MRPTNRPWPSGPKKSLASSKTLSLILMSTLLFNIALAQNQTQPSNQTAQNTTSPPSNNASSTPSNDTIQAAASFVEDAPIAVSNRVEDNYFDPVLQQEMEEKYGMGRVQINIQSIEPEAGPTEGETRVLVRGGPFKDMLSVYPHPKCRFGSNGMITTATYVTCSLSPTPAKSFEKAAPRDQDCLQCDNSPPSPKAEIVPLTVSLIGDFSDSMDSVAYRYYKTVIFLHSFHQPIIYAIQPRLGYKDGETRVTVWGEGFLNFDELSVCNFGTESVKAEFINSTRLLCVSPRSDVVSAPMPFSVSFNKQQNTKQNISYWYYNRPQIAMVVPNIGSDTGGYPIILHGQNLFPPFMDKHNYTNTSFCLFQNLSDGIQLNLKTRATVIDSTHVTCPVPLNNGENKVTTVNVTFNDQQYTDDVPMVYFFKTPIIYDIDPREGPTSGGTEVIIFGDRFNGTGVMTCKFGNKTVKAKFISSSQIKCISPSAKHPGTVPLAVSNGYERYSSTTSTFLYYETPEMYSFSPICGPTSGYTQITVYGKNFRNIGFGKTLCVFNGTIFMNATIMDSKIIKCDSPPLDSSAVSSDSGPPFYFVSITLDAGKTVMPSSLKFQYYRDPVITEIQPYKGPMRGGTLSALIGSGFRQEAACNVTVRYGALTQNITNVTNFTDTQINITSPPSNVPARVIVSVSLNGQQFLNDKVIHLKDVGNLFIYYQDVYVSDYSPKSGPTSGKTLVRVEGMGFEQFKDNEGNKAIDPMWVRYIDSITYEVIGEYMQVFEQTDDSFSFRTPPAPLDTKAIMEISFNEQDWQRIVPPNSTYSYTYYNAPKVISVSPPYGPVKSPNGERITLTGQNFNCPDSDCKDLMVRFGDAKNGIFIKGTKTGPNTVECLVPKYTKPDVLPVEVTFNGADYTNDNQTYGFFDPYILDVQPRLIHFKGTTKVRLYGVGFVNSTGTYLKVKFSSVLRGALNCNGADCVKMAEYIDKTTIESTTFPQAYVNYTDRNDNIQFDGMATEGCVYANTYTENQIEIYYFVDLLHGNLSQSGSPCNHNKPILAATDFQWDKNDYEKFKKYANFTCRFRSTASDKVIYTKAKMEVYPMGNQDDDAKPTHIKCATPKWGSPESVKFDISVNGQDYSGDYTYQFFDNLDLYRIYPMAGPNEGTTRVLLFGSGFSAARENVFVKWGTLYTEIMIKEQVMQYIWNETSLIQGEADKGNMVLKAYKEELFNDKEYYMTKRRDFELFEGQKLTTYYANAPQLQNWNCTHGGPVYMSVGEQTSLNITNYTIDETGPVPLTNVSYYDKIFFIYSYSYVEYYYYQNPVIKKVEPNTGLQRGGTRLEVSGAWFKYKAEYGIVPHCKIGDKISRAQFHSTVRIVCLTPPNEVVDSLLPVYVSLNGFDYVDTGFKFQYQIQTDLYSIYPMSGEEGTTILIKGSKFMKFSGNSKYKCKFTDLEGNSPPRYEYVYYKDNTTIQCNAARNFISGPARVQVTFNGDDYSDNNFTFFFYKINGIFPNSGPSDGNGGPILIIGDGFRNDPMEMNISCKLNGTDFAPVKIDSKVIACPVPPANRGETFPTRVDFLLRIDDAQKRQENGYWYFDQIIAEGMEPNIGPSVGKGIINFYVHNLNDSYDYFWANPGCKIGNSQGKGTIVGPVEIQQEGSLVTATLIQCIVEEMELVDKDYYLPATVALNSYSWVPTDFKYVPYGITDIIPNSGPIAGNTDMIVVGKGFNEDLQDKAFCRFGVGASTAVVQADILDYEQLLCRTPPGFTFPSYAELPVSVPISITLSDREQFNPWTETAHRFTFYQPPRIIAVDPEEVLIGQTQEIYVYADEDSEFLQPIPTYKDKRPSYDILCRFGRFKDGIGTFVNKTTIKCAIPSIKEDADQIWREDVTLVIAQNGKDFDDEFSDVSVLFVGTGSPLGFWSAILATLLIALLIVALVFFCGAWLSGRKQLNEKDKSYVVRDAYDQFTSRAYTSGMMGSRGSVDFQQ